MKSIVARVVARYMEKTSTPKLGAAFMAQVGAPQGMSLAQLDWELRDAFLGLIDESATWENVDGGYTRIDYDEDDGYSIEGKATFDLSAKATIKDILHHLPKTPFFQNKRNEIIGFFLNKKNFPLLYSVLATAAKNPPLLDYDEEGWEDTLIEALKDNIGDLGYFEVKLHWEEVIPVGQAKLSIQGGAVSFRQSYRLDLGMLEQVDFHSGMYADDNVVIPDDDYYPY